MQKERQWVVQETIIKSKGNYQQMMRNLPTNVLESTSIKECNYLSGNFSIIFLLPWKKKQISSKKIYGAGQNLDVFAKMAFKSTAL